MDGNANPISLLKANKEKPAKETERFLMTDDILLEDNACFRQYSKHSNVLTAGSIAQNKGITPKKPK